MTLTPEKKAIKNAQKIKDLDLDLDNARFNLRSAKVRIKREEHVANLYLQDCLEIRREISRLERE